MSPRPVRPAVCRECGKQIPVSAPAQGGIRRGLCVSCSFWSEKVSIRWQNCSVRIAGNYYEIAKGQAAHDLAQTRYVISFIDDRPRAERTVVTHNLVGPAPIPEHFRNRLPNNAKFEARG